MYVRCISCERVFSNIFESVRHQCARVAGPRLRVELEQPVPAVLEPCATCGHARNLHWAYPIGTPDSGCVRCECSAWKAALSRGEKLP